MLVSDVISVWWIIVSVSDAIRKHCVGIRRYYQYLDEALCRFRPVSWWSIVSVSNAIILLKHCVGSRRNLFDTSSYWWSWLIVVSVSDAIILINHRASIWRYYLFSWWYILCLIQSFNHLYLLMMFFLARCKSRCKFTTILNFCNVLKIW